MKHAEAYSILQLVAIDETGDSYYRMRWPAADLLQQAPQWTVVNLDARHPERIKLGLSADLLVVYQSHDVDLLPLIVKRRELGLKTLVEYNDNFYAPPAASPVAQAWSSPLIWQIYEQFMQLADAVIVTGEPLKSLFSAKTSRPIHVLENNIPLRLPQQLERWAGARQCLRLGLAGSLGHMPDYLRIQTLIRSLFERFPQLHLEMMGNEFLPDVFKLEPQRFTYTPWGSMQEYYKFWGKCHLGIVPVLPTAYNLCRSDVKALEIAACGALPVLVKSEVYENFLRATDAPSVSSIDELGQAVEELLPAVEKMQETAERCYSYVYEQRFGPLRRERLQLYGSYLPERSLGGIPGFNSGYQEISCGDLNALSQESIYLNQAQSLLNQGRKQEALAYVSSMLSKNKYMSGLALAQLKLQAGLAQVEAEKKLEESSQLFSGDLRFTAVLAPEQLELWSGILQELKAGNELYREGFFLPLLNAMQRTLSRHGLLALAYAEGLAECYPDSAELAFELANLYFQKMDIPRARQYAERVLQAKMEMLKNQQFLEKLDLQYLKTFVESLSLGQES